MPLYRVVLEFEVTDKDAAGVDQGAYGPTNADRLAGWFADKAIPYVETKSVKLFKIRPSGSQKELPITRQPDLPFCAQYP